MKVYCKACMVQLTPELLEYTGNISEDAQDGHDYIPKGYYKICDGTWGYTIHKSGLCEDEKGQIIINVKDLINAVTHYDHSKTAGCCGLDGCNGPNKICTAGHEVATEHSDCWHTWATVFDNDAVVVK
jgi:hypothetical protein